MADTKVAFELVAPERLLASIDADMVVITAWFSVFEAALRESMRLGAEWQGSHESLTTRPETWQPGVE